MNLKSPSIILSLIVALATAPAAATDDPHSYSQPEQVSITHLQLDLTTDFNTRTLTGTATFDLEQHQPEVGQLLLDTRDLDIQLAQASVDGHWQSVEFELAEPDQLLGAKLSIQLPQETGKVRVRYRTSPEASGLQWLNPQQTAGKNYPFLFTQSQAIHARSWIPLQDTPQVRFTYTATVSTPAGMKAVMSAENDAQDQDGEYQFDMPQAIPSYLLALAVGELRFEAMSERTGVYAEPSVLAAAVAEFDDTEAMMVATEQRFGEYDWGRYDLLILPPSFPFGGMENPRLSFITPTVIAGDKSLVSLIAHELAHSWSGNLVTNASWADLWLNEGFTTYLERRIIEDVYGDRRATMEAVLGFRDLQEDIQRARDDDQYQDTRLAIELDNRDPDEVFSDVPYEKGRLFLTWIEQSVGRKAFDQWLQGYFARHRFQSISTTGFLQDIEQHLISQQPQQLSMADLKQWIFEPGLPANHPVPESPAFTPIDQQRNDWLAGDLNAERIQVQDWSTQEWLYFLNKLPQDVGSARMVELDEAFALTSTGNNEIAHSWLKLAIHNDYQPAYARLESYLRGIGRRKLIVPLYEALVKTPQGTAFAQRVYQSARPGYHPLAQGTVDAIVAGQEDA